MKLLTLLRHAKSSWNDRTIDDHDRQLNERGYRDAPVISARLLSRGCSPDRILCSTAIRARETASVIIDTHKLDPVKVVYLEALYLASAGALLAHIESASADIDHLMLIGHNPGLEALGRQMHPASPKAMPTCGVSHYSIHSDSFVLDTHTSIELLFHDYPKNTI